MTLLVGQSEKLTPFEFNSHRLVNLWEIMNRFAADECGGLFSRMGQYEQICSLDPNPGKIISDMQKESTVARVIFPAEMLAGQADLQESYAMLQRLRRDFELNTTVSELWHKMTALRELMRSEMEKRLFLVIPGPPDGISQYYGKQELFGHAVYEAYRDARYDISKAGDCLACGLDTAAVFHLMRAVEWGLRALCVHFGFRKARSRIKKTGEITLTPIEYVDWEKMLSQLQSKVDKRIEKLKRGAEKQKLQEFYYPVLQDIKAFRDAWRNHVMHTRAIYENAQARSVMEHVRSFMMALVQRGVQQV